MEALIPILLAVLSSSVLTAVIAGIIGKWKTKAEKLKNTAEIESIVTATYEKLVGSLRIEVERLEKQVERMQKREENYLLHNNSLISDKQDLLARIQKVEKDRDLSIQEAKQLKAEVEELKTKMNS